MSKSARDTVAGLLDRLEAGWRLRPVLMYDLRVSSRWGFGQRRIPDWHLLYVRSGKGWYHLDANPVRLEAGRLLVIAPGFPHAARPDPADPPTIVPLRCSLEPPPGQAGWRPEPVALQQLLVGAGRKAVEARFSALFRWWQAEGSLPWLGLRQQAALVEILIASVEGAEGVQVVARDPFEQLRATLRSHPERRPDGVAMAREVGLSEKHFIRSFKARYGETPRACQIRMRCERAAYLLSETREGVAGIAGILGYPDAASFCKQFKLVMGCTPSAYRERLAGIQAKR